MKLQTETVNKILELQKKYPHRRSALIPALHIAQEEVGYLPREIQNQVAALFDLDPNDVNSVVTFYDMFHEEPVGKTVVHVCKNVSCMLRGSDELIDALNKKLNISKGETSPDGQYTIIPSECLGACDRAPVCIVGEKVVGPVKADELNKILDEASHA